MDTAAKILIAGGVIALAYGFALGVPLAMARMKVADAPRHLQAAHLESIIQAAVMLGLSVALSLSDLDANIETLAASLIVAGFAFSAAGATLNWRQRVGDQFAQRSLGWKLQAASGTISIVGAAIFVVGVLAGL